MRLNIKFLSFLVIVLGSISWSLTMVKSGQTFPFGMGFWGPNGHDGIWHLALINQLAKGSFQMPVFAGEPLRNYHIGFDLILAAIYKITQIPAQTLYFQLLPPILAVLVGIAVYKFVIVWRRSEIQALWAAFFVYFGGSFGWMVTLWREGKIGGESMFWAQQAISTLINPPFALSVILMIGGLTFLLKYLKEKRAVTFLLASLLFGVLIQIKAYAGVLALGGLFLAGALEWLKRKNWRVFGVFLVSALISAALYLPLNKSSAALLAFQPFWFLETMMGLSDRFGWPRFYSAMINYRWGNVWLKGIPAYLVAFLIFLVGNMGTRILGGAWIVDRLKSIKKASWLELFILVVIFAGAILPMLFLQAGTPWNTIQFFYYSLVFAGILSGIVFGAWLEKSKKIFLSSLLLAIFTLPTTFGTLVYHYLPARPPAKISPAELEALSFLEKQPYGVVLTYPFDRQAAEAAAQNPPRPLYLYESTAYVSAFSQKLTYLEDEVNLDITGYNWPARRQKIETFLSSLNHQEVWQFLRENKIAYVYWTRGQRAKLGETQLGIEQIFENEEVKIYRVL